MEDHYKGKVVVITGASSGFGKGVALSLASKGAILVLAARRGELLENLASICKQLGAEVLPQPTDVSIAKEVESLAINTISKYGSIDVWINDAGTAAVGPFNEIPLADHVKVIETDLLGTLYGSYVALNQFHKQSRGTLINIASMIGKVPAPYYASYAAAKHGVVGLTAALRKEASLRDDAKDIHVCTVLPMAMNTPFFEHANYSDKQTVPIPPMDDADKVIDTIVDLIKSPRGEVPVGMGGGANLILHNIAPALSECVMAQVTHWTQMENAPIAPPKEGAVQQPSTSGQDIRDPKLIR